MSDEHEPNSEESAGSERRRASSFNRMRRGYRHFTGNASAGFRKLFWVAAGAVMVFGVNECTGITKGFVRLPGRVEALTDRMAAVEPRIETAIAVQDSLQRGQSLDISWRCLDYAKADTARFRASRLACGEAFHRSRLDEDIWVPLRAEWRRLP